MTTDKLHERDDLLAALICQYEQALRAETEKPTFDDSALATDEELAERFDAARHGLEALDRVRLLWSPPESESASDGEHDTAAGPTETIDVEPKTIGRFRIQWELGRGGLGIVFLAHDPQLGRRVALKVPRIEALLSDEARERFAREAAAAARLNHPHLVGVYEVGEDAGICYIAAEYCPGITLRQWIARSGRHVPAAVAARVLGQLARAVQYAHGRGVLHRDIKPSNVLVEEAFEGDSAAQANSCEAPNVKLADFGMAKLIEHDGDQTRTGAILGTLAYMAPEQAEGRTADIDVRTDVYGLGAVLYELLTGRPPFQADTDAETLRQLLFTEVKRPSHTRNDVPRDLEAICLKCLARDPLGRYNTAQELSDDLERFLGGRATEARPLRLPEMVWKWVRRRPWAAAVAMVVLLSASALVATVGIYNARLQTAVTESEQSRKHAQLESESRRRLLYSADVRLAYETFQANDVVQAIEALDRQVPRTGEEDLREFAWHYLRRRCEPENRFLAGHEHTVFSVQFSPDGRMLATGGQDGTARLWDSATGAPLHVLRGHATEVTSVAFAPDGDTVATGSEDRTIRIWQTDTGETIRVLDGHKNHVQAIAYSPDGNWLASGSRDKTVRIWDAATGAARAAFDDRMDVIRAVAFSPSGDRLYAVDEKECLHAWETGSWNRAARERAERDLLFALAVSRDGSFVAAGGRRMEINVWRADNEGLSRAQLLQRGHSEWVQSLAFSPADDTLASGGKDGVIRLWDPHNATLRRTLLGHKDRIWSVAWSPDGQRLASAGAGAAVRLWDLSQRSVERYPPSPVDIACMDFAPDGATLAVGMADGTIRIWNPAQRTQAETFAAHSGIVANLRFSPDGSGLASTAKSGNVKLWSLAPPTEILQLPVADVSPVAWSPTGDRLAVTVDEPTVAIVDVDSGKVVHRIVHEARVRDVAFLPDGLHLATTSLESLDLWNIAAGRRVFTIPEGHTSLAVARDGEAVAAVKGPKVSLVDLAADGFRVATLVTSGVDAKSVACSPDGNTLAVTLLPPAVSLWDRRTGHELMRLPCDAQYISYVTFSPDGLSLLVCGTDIEGNDGLWEWTVRNARQTATNGAAPAHTNERHRERKED